MVWVFVLYGLFASVFTIAKVGLEYSSPFFLVGSRMALAGVIMLSYQWFAHRDTFRIKPKHLLRVFLLAFFNIYLTNVMEFWGLQYLTSFKTCFIYSLSPFMAALFSYLILDEQLTWRKWLGLGVGFTGFIPILLHHTTIEAAAGQLWILSWPEIAVIIAAISSSYGWIVLRQLVSEDGYAPLLINGTSMLIGGVLALGQSLATESWHPIPVTEFFSFFKCALFLIIVSNLMAYNLYGYLLKRFSGTFLSFAGFSTPLLTALFGWVFLGETITFTFMASAAIVFLGLVTFYQEELRMGYRAKSSGVPVEST
jgi:drug/metabolite transporter (DMT)-like permease